MCKNQAAIAAHFLSENLDHRQLSAGQRAFIAERIANLKMAFVLIRQLSQL